MRRDQRSDKAHAYRHLYNNTRWRKVRQLHLAANPLCIMCLPDVVPAHVCDHIREHKGDIDLFYDPSNLQSLCSIHHSSVKQAEERGSHRQLIGVDGWPVDQ